MMHPLPRILFLILCLAWLSVSFAAVAGDDPDPAEILRAARMNQSAQSALLEGRLRTADKSTPFQLTLDEGTVTYAFRDPPQDIVLKLGDDAPELFERLGNKRVEVTSARFDKTVRDTGITYEDLSLSFLYWPRPHAARQRFAPHTIRMEAGNPGAPQGESIRSRPALDRQGERRVAAGGGLQ